MKKIKLLICTSLLVLISSLCDGQSWVWACDGYGPFKFDGGNGISVATADNGNVYIPGILLILLPLAQSH